MPTLQSLPLAIKPRERILKDGVDTVPLRDLIAVILGNGSKNFSVTDLAEKVAAHLLNGCQSVVELQGIAGIGQVKALEISAAYQLYPTVQQQRAHPELSDPKTIYRAMADLIQEPQEHLVAFFVTVRQRQIQRRIISIGTVSASLIHAREVFREAIAANAAHLVLAHTHPSGSAEPSRADLQSTLTMYEAGRVVGIELLDHVVCAEKGYVSLRERCPKYFSQNTFIGKQNSFC